MLCIRAKNTRCNRFFSPRLKLFLTIFLVLVLPLSLGGVWQGFLQSFFQTNSLSQAYLAIFEDPYDSLKHDVLTELSFSAIRWIIFGCVASTISATILVARRRDHVSLLFATTALFIGLFTADTVTQLIQASYTIVPEELLPSIWWRALMPTNLLYDLCGAFAFAAFISALRYMVVDKDAGTPGLFNTRLTPGKTLQLAIAPSVLLLGLIFLFSYPTRSSMSFWAEAVDEISASGVPGSALLIENDIVPQPKSRDLISVLGGFTSIENLGSPFRLQSTNSIQLKGFKNFLAARPPGNKLVIKHYYMPPIKEPSEVYSLRYDESKEQQAIQFKLQHYRDTSSAETWRQVLEGRWPELPTEGLEVIDTTETNKPIGFVNAGYAFLVPATSETNKTITVLRRLETMRGDDITATIGFTKGGCGVDCNEFRFVGGVFAMSFRESAHALAIFDGHYELPSGVKAAPDGRMVQKIEDIDVGVGPQSVRGMGIYFDSPTTDLPTPSQPGGPIMVDATGGPDQLIEIPVERVACSGCGLGESYWSAKWVGLRARSAHFRLGGGDETEITSGDIFKVRGDVGIRTRDSYGVVLTANNAIVRLNGEVMNKTIADLVPVDRKIAAFLLAFGFLFEARITRWIKVHIRPDMQKPQTT